MYGLEKGKEEIFKYDLEADLKKDSKKAKETIADIEHKIHECKDAIKKGNTPKDIDNLTILLNGYTAAKKVLQTSLKSN
jgi:hypothetical protein